MVISNTHPVNGMLTYVTKYFIEIQINVLAKAESNRKND